MDYEIAAAEYPRSLKDRQERFANASSARVQWEPSSSRPSAGSEVRAAGEVLIITGERVDARIARPRSAAGDEAGPYFREGQPCLRRRRRHSRTVENSSEHGRRLAEIANDEGTRASS